VAEGSLRQTPFHAFHLRNNARMVDYAGWALPLHYPAGILAEHEQTRTAASLFDVSHMGRIKIDGKDATKFLSRLLTRNIEKAAVGQSAYSLICNESGGVLDDVIVNRFDGHWLMVCNAANREKLLGWFDSHRTGYKVGITDETFTTAMVALQGPKAIALLDEVLPQPASDIRRYHFEKMSYMMVVSFTVFRTGYTGEDGVEIILGNQAAGLAMNYLLKTDGESAVLKPAGLGARDTLRLEAGMPLYGHELTETIDPISAGLKWAVDLEKEFIGGDALRSIASAGPKQLLVGLNIDGPRAARHGMTVLYEDKPVGTVTSGAMSPTLKRCIALAFVDAALAAPGTKLTIDLRGTMIDAVVTPLPFYKRPAKTA
jgi:aminomethyltransferase